MRDTESVKIVPKYWDNPKVLERAYQFIQEKLEENLEDHKSRENKWLAWDKAYRLIDDEKPTDGGCQVVDPEPQTIVDVMKANYVEAFFSQDPNFEYKGQDDTDDEQAEIMTAYRADHLRRISLRDKFERTVHQWLVYGTGICKDPYRKESRKKIIKRKIEVRDNQGNKILNRNGDVKTKIVTEEVDVKTWDDTDWEYVSIFDFIPVGKGSSIQSLEGMIHRVRTNWDSISGNELKKTDTKDGEVIEGVYVGLKDIDPEPGEFDLLEYWGKISKWVITGEESDKPYTFEGVISALIDIDASWELMMQGNHGEKTGEIPEISENPLVAPNKAIRCQENPFWHGERPFRAAPHTPVEDEFYGIGMIEPIMDKWKELNTTIRQLVDNKTLQLLNPTIEDVNANVQRDVKLYKFPRIKADDVNAVQPLRINDFSANGWRLVAALKEDIRRSSGALETIQGMPLNQDRTSATEFQGIYQQAGVRIKNRIRLFDDLMFKKFLDRSYINDMQFADTERIVKVTGEKGVRFKRVGPESIWGTFDIVTYGPTQFENKVIKLNNFMNFFSVAIKAAQFANIPALLKKMYVKMDVGPEHEANELVISNEPESPRELEEENMAMAMGQPAAVNKSDNHKMHIQAHMQATQKLIQSKMMNEQVYKVFEDHVNRHLDYIGMLQQQQMQAMQAQGAMNQMAQNGPGVAVPNVSANPTVNPMEQMPL